MSGSLKNAENYYGKKSVNNQDTDGDDLNCSFLQSMEQFLQSPEQHQSEEIIEEILSPVDDTEEYNDELTEQEKLQMIELSKLPPDQLAAKIEHLKDELYQIGLREAEEMKRGLRLNIFGEQKK